jgi:hypothetical protein
MLYLNRIQKCTAIAQTIFHEKAKESCSYDEKIEDMQIQLSNVVIRSVNPKQQRIVTKNSTKRLLIDHHIRECSVSVFPSWGFVTPLGCTRKLNKKGLNDQILKCVKWMAYPGRIEPASLFDEGPRFNLMPNGSITELHVCISNSIYFLTS